MATTPVLLTRPRPDAERFARALGLTCTIAPLMEVAFTAPAPRAQALLFTSANGVAAWRAGGGARGLHAWCVGPRTARAARLAGLVVRGVAANAAVLARIVPAGAPPLVWARGVHARGDPAGTLQARGLVVTEAILYEARSLPLGPAGTALARAGPVVAPVFSSRAAQLLSAAWPLEALPHLRAVALSPAVAEALPVPSVVAERPDGDAMLRATLAAIHG